MTNTGYSGRSLLLSVLHNACSLALGSFEFIRQQRWSSVSQTQGLRMLKNWRDGFGFACCHTSFHIAPHSQAERNLAMIRLVSA